MCGWRTPGIEGDGRARVMHNRAVVIVQRCIVPPQPLVHRGPAQTATGSTSTICAFTCPTPVAAFKSLVPPHIAVHASLDVKDVERLMGTKRRVLCPVIALNFACIQNRAIHAEVLLCIVTCRRGVNKGSLCNNCFGSFADQGKARAPPVVVGGGVGGVQLEGAVVVGDGVVPAAQALVRERAVVERPAVVRADRNRCAVVRHCRLKVALPRRQGNRIFSQR